MVFSQKYETQEYRVVEQIDNAEIRFYPSAAMVKISADQNRNNNFGKLFRVIQFTFAFTSPLFGLRRRVIHAMPALLHPRPAVKQCCSAAALQCSSAADSSPTTKRHDSNPCNPKGSPVAQKPCIEAATLRCSPAAQQPLRAARW